MTCPAYTPEERKQKTTFSAVFSKHGDFLVGCLSRLFSLQCPCHQMTSSLFHLKRLALPPDFSKDYVVSQGTLYIGFALKRCMVVLATTGPPLESRSHVCLSPRVRGTATEFSPLYRCSARLPFIHLNASHAVLHVVRGKRSQQIRLHNNGYPLVTA